MTDDQHDEAQEVAKVAALHQQVRAWIAATWPTEPLHLVASALAYEVVSLTACAAQTQDEAHGLLASLIDGAVDQIAQHGVGHPHPGPSWMPAQPEETP